jgi:hypothetical protein
LSLGRGVIAECFWNGAVLMGFVLG